MRRSNYQLITVILIRAPFDLHLLEKIKMIVLPKDADGVLTQCDGDGERAYDYVCLAVVLAVQVKNMREAEHWASIGRELACRGYGKKDKMKIL